MAALAILFSSCGFCLVMAALRSRCRHYIFALSFLSFFFFSSHNLSCRRLDVYHTFTHGEEPKSGLSANLECRSEMCCTRLAGNTGRKNVPSWYVLSHNFVVLANKACIDNRGKKLLNSNIAFASTCPRSMVNFGQLTAEIYWRVWGTGRHLYLAGRPSRWASASAHILVSYGRSI